MSSRRICWIATRRSDAPTPQLAPIATGATGSSAKTSTSSGGRRPIIVRPAVSNDAVTVYGIPTAIAASAAARISCAADFVSIQAMSAPPARNPSISSVNAAIAAASVMEPIGSINSPVGPTDPATTTGCGAAAATSAAISAARFAISNARSSAPCNANRNRLQPNVLVRMMSAPASTNCWCRRRTLSGASRFHSSGGSPGPRPIPMKLVPVAPSASNGPPRSRSASSVVRMHDRRYCLVPATTGVRPGRRAEPPSRLRGNRRRERS